MTERGILSTVFITVMGVVLPIVAVILELMSGISGSIFFDPFPTLFHVALVATIPLSNTLMVVALQRGYPVSPRLALLHGFATGTALIYALFYLPVAPIAVLAIVVGVGFLPLAPLLSFIAALRARKLMATMSGSAPPYLWRGMALALGAILVLETPAAVTRVGMGMAMSGSAATQLDGVRWLRAVGNEELMLRYCHPHSKAAGGLFSMLLDLKSSFSAEQAQSVFFKVTGTTYNSHPAPPVIHNRLGLRDTFDWELGGDKVGRRASGVHLTSSRMDGSIDANAALGYLEWTMVFNNRSDIQQEGRAEIVLPTGAVVSRATLWIDGEEREAAFGGRAQVRQAYERVVASKRDPLLVTTAGTGRVLVQLFPIPPAGEMKIRIGITAPMVMSNLQRASLQLPSISERNFDIDPALRHAVWIESKTALEGSDGLRAEQASSQLFALRGNLAEPGPRQNVALIEATRTLPNQPVWSRDDKRRDGVIVQTISEQPVATPRRAAIVLDGSVALRTLRRKLADVLAAAPPGVELGIVFAGDVDADVFRHNPANVQATRDYINRLDFEGGRNNGDALVKAWEWTAQVAGGAVVWIHGPQPEAGGIAVHIEQSAARRPATTKLYDLQVSPGPNLLGRKLEGQIVAESVPRKGSATDDLQRLIAQWQPGAKQVAVLRTRQRAVAMSNDSLTSPHLTRLWAAAQVNAMGPDEKQRTAAISMATTYQLVTPVSGAVVLETKAQYDEAGLEPVKPGSVPTIPEPETWALIIVALVVLVLRRRLRRV